MGIITRIKKSKVFRSVLLLVFGLLLIYASGCLKVSGYDEITVTVIGHIGIAFLIVFITFVVYEKLKEEEEKKKMDRIGEDVFSETIGTIVPGTLKNEIIEILRNTGFIKTDYIYRIIIDTDEKNNIIGYEKIVQFTVKNLTNKSKSYHVRMGFSSDDDVSDLKCKIDGEDVNLEAAKDPIKNIGNNTKEFFKEIKLGCEKYAEVVLTYKVKLSVSFKVSNTIVMLDPCEKVSVKVAANRSLKKNFDISIIALSSGSFIENKNIIHENHMEKTHSGCMLPFQGFTIEVEPKKLGVI
ncbi:MAG: hypothetical protein WC304_01415 [Candidatus Gracilibacteria bacterium]|jgi:hypothetical protein